MEKAACFYERLKKGTFCYSFGKRFTAWEEVAVVSAARVSQSCFCSSYTVVLQISTHTHHASNANKRILTCKTENTEFEPRTLIHSHVSAERYGYVFFWCAPGNSSNKQLHLGFSLVCFLLLVHEAKKNESLAETNSFFHIPVHSYSPYFLLLHKLILDSFIQQATPFPRTGGRRGNAVRGILGYRAVINKLKLPYPVIFVCYISISTPPPPPSILLSSLVQLITFANILNS